MADFDERALRSPSQPPQSIGSADLAPWMVWTAAGAIGALALTGLYLGLHGGHPASGVGLTLARGAALDPATAASAAPAVALPKTEPWSTLSGPEVLAKSAAQPKSAAAAETDSGEEASGEPVAAADAADQAEPAPAPPAAQPAAPAQTQTPAAQDNPALY
jgi:hypothetical protein